MEVERADKVIAAVGPDEPLTAGDRLVFFVGNLARVLDLQRMSGLISAEARHFDDLARNPQRQFVEAVIGAGSPLIGTSLKASGGFRRRYGSAVVAIHRASEQLKGKLGDVRLRAGDVLLVLAGPDFHQRYREHRDFAVVSPLNQDRPIRREHARTVELAIAALIVLAGTGLLDLLQVSLLIAFGLIVARIVTLRDARRFIDANVLLLMATSFGLGMAVEQSGLAASLANLVVNSAAPLGGDYGLLAAVLAATMLVTEVISNTAAAALMFPHRHRGRRAGRCGPDALRGGCDLRCHPVVPDAHRLSDQHHGVGHGWLSIHRLRAPGCASDAVRARGDAGPGAGLLSVPLKRNRYRPNPPGPTT